MDGDTELVGGGINSLSHGIEPLKEQVEKEEKKLKSLCLLLDNIEAISVGKNLDDSVLQNKYATLKAESLELQQHEVEGIPLNKDLQVALLKQHMENNVTSLKDFLEHLRLTKTKLMSQKKRLQDHLTKEKKVISYTSDLEESQPSDFLTPVSAVDEYVKELTEKLKKLKTLNELRVSQLRVLMARLYSRPDPLVVAEIGSEDFMDFEKSNVQKKTLLQLIEVLVNAALVTTDPWVTIDSTMWDPYIEMLSRIRLIVRHPNNKNLIKLEKFYDE